MNFFSPLADACPGCHPGDHAAVLPFLVTRSGESLRAWYKHEACASMWATGWDAEASGWPQGRELLPPVPFDPVTPEEAARNRAVLERELEEYDCYHRTAGSQRRGVHVRRDAA